MTTPGGDLMFVPLFGSSVPGCGWETMPHIKAWGFLNPADEMQLTAIYVEGDVNACIPLFEPCSIFEAEVAAATRIGDGDTVPAIVSVRLAQLALAPHTLVTQE